MTKPAGYYDLREAFGQSGCPLCRLLAQNASNYIDAVLWELVNDPETREKLNQTRGYCREHAWRLVRYGTSLSVAIMTLGVLETTLRVLEESRPVSPPASSLQQLWQVFSPAQAVTGPAATAAALAPQAPCPVCLHLQQSEGYYVKSLLEHLAGPDSLISTYTASDGLCLPHFRLILGQVKDEQASLNLVEAQKTVWQRLAGDLREFIRKKDYRFSHEEIGEEGDAWLRALEAVAGAPPVQVKR